MEKVMLDGKEDMFTKNKNLVHYIIHKHYPYFRNSIDYEDAFQCGSIGLMRAIERFDPKKGFKFSTFAYPVILTTIYRGVYPFFSSTKISRNANDDFTKYKKYLDEGYEFEEIAEILDISPKNLIDIVNAFKSCSLDDGTKKDPKIKIIDVLADNSDIENDFELKTDLKKIKNLCKLFLPDDDYFMVTGYYSGVSQVKISEILKTTQVTVSRRIIKVEKNIFPLFRKYVNGEIGFGRLCLSILRKNKNTKYAVGKYLEYIFKLPNPPAGFLEEVKDELECWTKGDFNYFKSYFTENKYSLHFVINNLTNLLMIIDKYFNIDNIEELLI